MMTNSKVLTVSYGTFSCTLEGFEDSFGTMKVIAEYFRDLAADDRYFGAEPPQPDSEMLARIAEKGIARHVKGSQEDGHILLSAEAHLPSPPPPSDETPPVAEPEQSITPATDNSQAAVPTAAQPAAPTLPAHPVQSNEYAHAAFPAPDRDAPKTSIASKLARIRAVVSKTEQEASWFGEDEYTKPSLFDGPPIELVQNAPAEEYTAQVTPPVSEPTPKTADIAAQPDSAPPLTDVTPDATPAAEATTEPKEDITTAAQNTADEAVQTPQPAAAKTDQPDPTPPSPTAETDANTASQPQASPEPMAIKAEDQASDASVPAEKEYEDNDIASILSRLSTHKELHDPSEDQPDASLEDGAPAPEKQKTDTAVQANPKPRGRVIKVKRRDLEAAINTGQLEEVPQAEPEIISSLSQEDEFDLQRALAAVEAEFEPASPKGANGSDFPAPAQVDTDLERLMAEADTHMVEPESAQNRDAFAHLRAAAAEVKISDHAIDPGKAESDAQDAYRTDLAEAVQPESESALPNKPAPLVLVASQRIDQPLRQQDSADPKTDYSGAPASGIDNFKDYAEQKGAHTLSQIVEAATAYITYVEQQEAFSRRQVMVKLRTAVGHSYSREEKLRAFGKLLRTGKIQRLESGNFSVSESIGFIPETREAG